MHQRRLGSPEEGNRGPGMGRRRFLQLASAAAVALSARVAGLQAGRRPAYAASEPPEEPTWEETIPPTPLGRIATWWAQAVRETPTLSGTWLETKRHDDVINLHGQVEGESPWPTNAIWYRTDGGYIHSGYVQPVRDDKQRVMRIVSRQGFWAQVATPWAEARWSITSPYVAAKLYYGTVYRVVKTVLGEDGNAWYQLKEGYTPYRPSIYVPATSLRPVLHRDLQPISPGRPGKVINIDRATQSITCLEAGNVVYSTPCATGRHATPTPRGEFAVLYKRHTRRMNVQDIADPYDLPGVAFPTYFTWSGVAIHGTYWHNDYGRVHSHGCVNVSPGAAQWIFRWVDPVCPYAEYTAKADSEQPGTRVVVS